MEAPTGIELSTLRQAIREERKIEIRYSDEVGRETRRVIWPLALIYYSENTNIVAWCELRQDLRNFRADRVSESHFAEGHFRGSGDRLRQQWMSGWAANAARV